jgi:hypothetical protein
MIWDPGGFQCWRRGAHEQELMFFLAEEYDAGASLQLSKSTSNVPAKQHISMHSKEKGGPTLSF